MIELSHEFTPDYQGKVRCQCGETDTRKDDEVCRRALFNILQTLLWDIEGLQRSVSELEAKE